MVSRQASLKIRSLFSGKGLAARAARGTLWLGAGSGVEALFRFIRNLILIRLLDMGREVFGLMAIMLAVNSLFESFTEVGVRQAIIQNPRGDERLYLNAAWWFACVRALCLYALGYAASPWIGSLYENADLVGLLRVVFLSLLLRGTVSPNAYVALKRMQYGRWAAIVHGAAVIGVVTTLVTAIFFRNVTALLIGFLAEAASQVVLSYALCPFRPGIRFDRKLSVELLRYARGMVGIPILTFIFLRGEIFVVGKLCPLGVLGIYSVVLSLARMPVEILSRLVPQIAMPAFSEMQDNPERLNKVLLGSLAVLLGLGLPAVAFALLYGKPLIGLVYPDAFYGEAFATMAIVFGLSVATGFMRLMAVPIANMYFAVGRPALHRAYAILRAILLAALIYPATRSWGPVGAAGAVLVAALGASLFHVGLLSHVTGLKLRRYAALVLTGVVLSLPVALAWWATRAFEESHPILTLAGGVAGCAVSVGAGALMLHCRRNRA